MTEIFVFGSNLQGIHKRGAALSALQNHGAVLGIGNGIQGFSYAIPTKETPYRSLSLQEINVYVAEFILFAANNPEYTFNLTKVGCGMAGYSAETIAPLFYLVKTLWNVKIPADFVDHIPGMKEKVAEYPNLIAEFDGF